MRFQCLIIILVLTNNLAQSYNKPNQSDLTDVEEMLKNILKKFVIPLQKLIEHIINQIKPIPPPPPGPPSTPGPPQPPGPTPPSPPGPPSTPGPPPPPECLCGRSKSTSRIVHGERTGKNEFPWQVRLTTGRGDKVFCGGSIVSTKTIVTAAHCLKGLFDDLWVVVAEHDVSKPDGEKYYKVCDHVKHPSYRADIHHNDYDYAILTLCKELTWGLSVAPVCLPSTNDEGWKYENKIAIASGWGSTKHNPYDTLFPDKLQKVTLHTMRNKVCCIRAAYTTPYHNCSHITPRMICAAGMSKGPCVGDDGGPLVVQDPVYGAYILAGIVSWLKPPCGASYSPGVYARVTDQLQWLNNNTKGSNCQIGLNLT